MTQRRPGTTGDHTSFCPGTKILSETRKPGRCSAGGGRSTCNVPAGYSIPARSPSTIGHRATRLRSAAAQPQKGRGRPPRPGEQSPVQALPLAQGPPFRFSKAGSDPARDGDSPSNVRADPRLDKRLDSISIDGNAQDFQSWTRLLESGTPNQNSTVPVTVRVSVGAAAQVTPCGQMSGPPGHLNDGLCACVMTCGSLTEAATWQSVWRRSSHRPAPTHVGRSS